MKLGRVAIDGSKIKANASKHKAMSYERMKRRAEAAATRSSALLEEAERIDAEEDGRYGRDSLRRRTAGDCSAGKNGAPFASAKRAWKIKPGPKPKRAKAAAEREPGQEARTARAAKEAQSRKRKDQYNFTDPESRIMKGPDGFVQGYNAQVAVEPELQLIVGQTVTDATNDKQQLLPMVTRRSKRAMAESSAGRQWLLLRDEPGKGCEASPSQCLCRDRAQKHDQSPGPCSRGTLTEECNREWIA